MKNIQAIIFDWGDTLMRDSTEFQGAMVHWPQVEAVPGISQALEQLCGKSREAGKSELFLMCSGAWHRNTPPWFTEGIKGQSSVSVPTLNRAFPYEKPQVEHSEASDACTGVFHGKVVCCVASNAGDSDAELMGQALARVGIRRYFDHLFTSRELGATKPDPAFFHEILRRLAIEPQACVMVGNDYQKDIISAKAVGLRTIWFSEAPVTNPAPCADAVIHSMADLVTNILPWIKSQHPTL